MPIFRTKQSWFNALLMKCAENINHGQYKAHAARAQKVTDFDGDKLFSRYEVVKDGVDIFIKDPRVQKLSETLFVKVSQVLEQESKVHKQTTGLDYDFMFIAIRLIEIITEEREAMRQALGF